jgi:hypothetical protein
VLFFFPSIFFFENICCFYKHFYLYIIWVSTKLCITPAEGMNAYLHKCAYKYTYICICDSLIIGNFGNPLYFAEISYYLRFVAHLKTKNLFHSLILLFFLPSHLPSYKSTHHLICHFHNKYTTHVQSVHIKCQNTSFYYSTHTFHHTACITTISSSTHHNFIYLT